MPDSWRGQCVQNINWKNIEENTTRSIDMDDDIEWMCSGLSWFITGLCGGLFGTW
jgi:hypothetical protein